MRNIEENTKEIQRKYSVLQLLKEKFMKVQPTVHLCVSRETLEAGTTCFY